MIRTVSRPRPIAAIFAGVLAVGAFAPTRVWANDPDASPAIASGAEASGKSSDDTSDEASRLVVLADFNRDGIADIAKATLPAGDHTGPGVLTVSLGRADGTFQQTSSKPVLGHGPRSIVAVDSNRDGIPDLIVGDDDGSLMLFLGDGKGNLVPAGNIAHLDSVVSIAVADFNHDGIPDMAVSDWRANAVVLLLGASDGSFRRGWSFPLRMQGTAPNVVAADFNGDGIPDLVVVYGDDGEYTYDVMLGDGKGNFTRSLKLSLVKDPNSHCNT
jgi:FG-GAP-like repeat